jgi:hypothetical protein
MEQGGTTKPGDEATGPGRILVGGAEWLTLAPGAELVNGAMDGDDRTRQAS